MLSPPSARRAEAIGEGRGHLNWDTKVVAGVHRTLPLGPIFFRTASMEFGAGTITVAGRDRRDGNRAESPLATDFPDSTQPLWSSA